MRMTIALVGLMLVSSLGWAETTNEVSEEENILFIADEPGKVVTAVQNTSLEDLPRFLNLVILQIEKLDIPDEEKRTRVALLLGLVSRELGDSAGPVLLETTRNINPDLLAPVAVGGGAPMIGTMDRPRAQPLAPPIAPRYPGQ